jgi:mRNA interferase RelE/StbE
LSEYRIFETDEFDKKLKKLSSVDSSFQRKKLSAFVYPQIRKEPFWGNNIKKLQGYTPDTWRYRIGKFRIFYIVDLDERIIYILSVDHRKDAYR